MTRRCFYRNGLLVQQRYLSDKLKYNWRLQVEMTLPGDNLCCYTLYYDHEPTPAELRGFAAAAKAFLAEQMKEAEDSKQ